MPAPKRRSSRSRLLAALLAAVTGASLAQAGREAWRHETEDLVREPTAPPATLDVPPGASADWIARQLAGHGFVRHPLVFRAFVHGRGVGQSLRAGEYALDSSLSLAAVVDKMVRGDVVRRDITFPEGKNLAEAAKIVDAKKLDGAAFLRAAKDPSLICDLDPEAEDLEGYLFPDTYRLTKGMRGEEILVRMVQRFREKVATPAILARARARGLSLHELVTLASIIEKEAVLDHERRVIAGVFWNRLQRNMPLQADPTVAYAVGKDGRAPTRTDLQVDHPFNTYRYRGLPPGPIANPGLASVEAALAPADVPYLFFVSIDDRQHHFSTTLEEHNRAVARYRESRAPRAKRS